MVLIDSPTDLMATATRQIPTSIRRADFIDRDERENSYLIDRDETGNRESMQNVYLRGAYEKRLKELERFAEDKNFWALADHQESNEEIFNDVSRNNKAPSIVIVAATFGIK